MGSDDELTICLDDGRATNVASWLWVMRPSTSYFEALGDVVIQGWDCPSSNREWPTMQISGSVQRVKHSEAEIAFHLQELDANFENMKNWRGCFHCTDISNHTALFRLIRIYLISLDGRSPRCDETLFKQSMAVFALEPTQHNAARTSVGCMAILE